MKETKIRREEVELVVVEVTMPVTEAAEVTTREVASIGTNNSLCTEDTTIQVLLIINQWFQKLRKRLR